MKIGIYDLTITNDGDGIYINSHLVDDKRAANDYWQGWEYWVNKLSSGKLYDYYSRNKLISQVRKKN